MSHSTVVAGIVGGPTSLAMPILSLISAAW